MPLPGRIRILVTSALAATFSVAGAQSTTSPRYGVFGIDLEARDLGKRPGDDFWAYANGGWDARTTIASDRGTAGNGPVLSDAALFSVRRIVDEAAANPESFGATGQRLAGLYASWMNVAEIERRGTNPLRPYLTRISSVRDLDELQILFASVGYATPVAVGIGTNPADPTRYIAQVGQGALGMPRDYYLLPGTKFENARTSYRAYVEQIQRLAGLPDAAARTGRILALEKQLATLQWSPEQSRDLAGTNDVETVAGLERKAPGFNWPLLLRTAGVQTSPRVLMTQNTALTALGKLMTATPLEVWREYLAFRFVSDHATLLPRAFDEANSAFYGRVLSGVPEQRERWVRGIQLLNGSLGEEVGARYVARHYPPESERQMGELIDNLKAAYRGLVSASGWMDPATKRAALAKLAAFEPRVGHPARYIDYSSLEIDRDDLFGNAMRAAGFRQALALSRFPRTIDRALWEFNPQTVDAYYDPTTNQLTFPAGILQAPFFDPGADPAVNYGAIGAIIGHEMGHGFDDQRSQYGPTGRLENWWSPGARKAFDRRTAALVAQYNAYEPIQGTRVNGRLTLGENIGDLGGLEAAHAAYRRFQAVHGAGATMGGLTPEQRFFIAYAQTWRAKAREHVLRAQLLTDPHSPPAYRVNGVVRNVDAWYRAFNVRPGDALYVAPKDRVHIW